MSKMISNPIQNVKLNYSADELANVLKFVDKTSPNFTLQKSNDVLKSFKFGNRDGISMIGEGNVIDVRVEELDNISSNLVIEGSRLIGSINSSAEVMAVKEGMDELLDVISSLVGKENLEKAAQEASKNFKKSKSLFNYLGSFIKWSFIGLGVWIVYLFAYYAIVG